MPIRDRTIKPLAASGAKPAKRNDARSKAADPLDDINRSIITELQKDGRRSYTAIAERVGLSHSKGEDSTATPAPNDSRAAVKASVPSRKLP